MKYSFLIPYYKRAGHLHNTLVSFCHHYSERDDYEVILAEDSKNLKDVKEHNQLLKIVEEFKNKINIILIPIGIYTWNPCIAFNAAAKMALGEYFIVTNPECFHMANILKGLDEEFEKNSSVYVVCSSMNRLGCKHFIKSFDELGGTDSKWFSHSIHRPGCLHFCNALSRKSWDKVRGFDEEYVNGIAYDDNDFINRVKRTKLRIVRRDDLLTIHISHSDIFAKNPEKRKLWNINRKIYQRKWD